MAADFKFEIIESYGTFSEKGDYTKEVNLIRYGDREPVVDIRNWTNIDGDKKMGKGITISKAEFEEFQKLISEVEVE